MIGVRADGRKELVALTDGYRESTESWAGLLRDAKRRGRIRLAQPRVAALVGRTGPRSLRRPLRRARGCGPSADRCERIVA